MCTFAFEAMHGIVVLVCMCRNISTLNFFIGRVCEGGASKASNVRNSVISTPNSDDCT